MTDKDMMKLIGSLSEINSNVNEDSWMITIEKRGSLLEVSPKLQDSYYPTLMSGNEVCKILVNNGNSFFIATGGKGTKIHPVIVVI